MAAAWQNIKWIRLTPTVPGVGGVKPEVHTFQAQPVNDMFSIYGFHVYKGHWRRDVDSMAEANASNFRTGASVPLAIHGYVYPSLTNPAAQQSIAVLGQHTFSGNTEVWDFTNNAVRATRATSTQPGTFLNVSGRCYYGEGVAEGMVFDSRTPAIHAQPNQNLGIGTPTQPLGAASIFPVPNVTPYAAVYVANGSANTYINTPNPNSPVSTILAGEQLTLSLLNTNMPAMYSGALPASAAAVANGQSSNITPFTANGTISIDPAVDPTLVTLSGATWPANFAYCGLAINFNGYSFVILDYGPRSGAQGFDLNGTLRSYTNTQLLIGGVYTGPALTNVPYTITGCQVVIPGVSTLTTNQSNPSAVPPGIAQGYSQFTSCNTVMVRLFCLRASGAYRNLGNISLGPLGGGTPQTVTDGKMTTPQNIVISASGPFVGTDVGKTIIIDGAGAGGSMLPSSIVTWRFPTQVQIADNASTSVTNVRVWWGTGLASIVDATMGAASTTLTSASNPFTVNDVGKTIMVDKAGAGGKALFTTITVFGTAGSVTLGLASTGAVSGVLAYYGAGTSGTTTGPTYAYAWYDPETGHMSNVSPLYQIPKPTTLGSFSDFANLTPVFQIDAGSISYPNQSTDGLRFSHLVFFRTLSTGGSTLYPIGSLQPFVGKVHPGSVSTSGSWNPALLQGWYGLPNSYSAAPPSALSATPPTYWFDFSSDADLILAGGFRAPQFTNAKPYVTLRGGATQPAYPYVMAYWNRRLWIVATQEPDKIAYSCDDAQCPLGIPTESFPPSNFLRLPSVDGRVMGMRVFGDMLLITTERLAYIIAGNNESNYRLMKVSSSMPGVTTYMMDEFPTYSGAEGEPTTIYYVGRDRNFYQWTMGGPVVRIKAEFSWATNPSLYSLARVHCVSAWGRRFVAVLIPAINAPQGALLNIWDIDNQVWSTNYISDLSGSPVSQNVAFSTLYGINPSVDEIFVMQNANGVGVRSWVRDDVTTSFIGQAIGSNLDTYPSTFDGKKTLKQPVMVNIHSTGPGSAWQVYLIVNESQTRTFSATPQAYPDPLDSIYGDNPNPVDGGATTADMVVVGAQFDSSLGQPVKGYRFQFVFIRLDSIPVNIYAIDIGYIDAEDPGTGEA